MAQPLIFIYGTPGQYKNYCRALTACGGQFLLSRELAGAEHCSGLLLPGGGDLDPLLYGQAPCGSAPADRERDAAELGLTRRFFSAGKPILGICRGLQVLNVALEGTLVQDLPGHSQVDGQDRMHEVSAVPGSLLFRLCGNRFFVNSAHHQAVDRPGRGLRITCRADDGIVEGLEHEIFPVFGVQWHPERMPENGDSFPFHPPIFDYFLEKCLETIQ